MRTAAPQTTSEPLPTSRLIADWLGVSDARLSQLRFLGNGPEFVRIGTRGVRYQPSAVEKWITAQTKTQT